MPIKVQKIKPFSVVSSLGLGRSIDNSILSARRYFDSHYGFSSWRNARRDGKSYVYLYRIEKINTKKANTKKKQTSSKGNKVVKRSVVVKGETKLFIYRFESANVVSYKQHNRHFDVVVKF